MSEKILQVGDKIFTTGELYHSPKIIEIERVTKTQAISGQYRFKREYHNSWVSQVGQNSYSRITFRPARIEDIERVEMLKKIRTLNSFDFGKLDKKKIDKILKIIL